MDQQLGVCGFPAFAISGKFSFNGLGNQKEEIIDYSTKSMGYIPHLSSFARSPKSRRRIPSFVRSGHQLQPTLKKQRVIEYIRPTDPSALPSLTVHITLHPCVPNLPSALAIPPPAAVLTATYSQDFRGMHNMKQCGKSQHDACFKNPKVYFLQPQLRQR